VIDLNRTKAQMLSEIHASERAFANCLNDAADPGFVSLDEACLTLKGETPDDLLPALEDAFSKRFASVPPDRLSRDLIDALKKGIGNAYKRGNRKDPAKQITVEAVVTNTGAVVAISDEGEGFDVGHILDRFLHGEKYFTYGGSGFEHFDRTKSLISYANGGRTLLIRFWCAPKSGPAPVAGANSVLETACNEEFIKSLLAAELSYFRKNKAALEACLIYPPDKYEDEAEIKYVLEYRRGRSERLKHATLTGRLLPEPAARTDFSVAEQLYKGPFRGRRGVQIPRPLMAFKQPPLVLFKFNPAQNLRDYLKNISDFQEVAEIIKMVALGLRSLHQSMIVLEIDEPLGNALERYRAATERVVTKLAQASPQQAERAQRFCSRLMEQAATLNGYEPVPIHGAFGLKSILYGDNRFYFYRFDKCRRSHPGFDVGNFLAELLKFYLLRKKAEPNFYYAGREVFLEAYFGRNLPSWQEDLPFFLAGALLLRFDRLLHRRRGKKWKCEAFLEQCEPALQ